MEIREELDDRTLEGRDRCPETAQSLRGYRKPKVLVIGSATSRIRQNIDGHLKDGIDGWWVWGS